MTLYQIKPAFRALLRPLMFWLDKKSVTANHVTLAAMALSFVTGAVLFIFPEPKLFILLPIVLFIRMALNALDGMLARERNQQSRLGAILNETGDILSDPRCICRLCCFPAVMRCWYWLCCFVL